MKVLKRNGQYEAVDFNKVQRRIENMANNASVRKLKVDAVQVAQKVVNGIVDGISTKELDQLACEVAQNMVLQHPDYGQLAGNIAWSNLHKSTPDTFSAYVSKAYHHRTKDDVHAPLVSKEFYEYVMSHQSTLDDIVQDELDFEFDYVAYKTLENSYLLRTWQGDIIERLGYLYLRVAVQLYGIAPKNNSIEGIRGVYQAMHNKLYTHATPTLFNSGTNLPQLASCFLLDMKEDSIDGIYDTLKRTAQISKLAGGIGLTVSKVRAKNSYIKGTGGYSNGLVPMLKNFNETARYVDQGGGKRKGAFAIYIEPWHADIEDVLMLRKNHGKEELRARDLFPALWVPDIFMKRVEQGGSWSLFSPSDVPELTETWGEEFEKHYLKAEADGKAMKVIPAERLMMLIAEAQQETGTPYMLYKDTVNSRNNQAGAGIIRSSNLCFTGDTLVAVKRKAVDELAATPTIRQLAELSGAGKVRRAFTVYGAQEGDDSSWETCCQNAVAFKSGTREVVKVTLSNGHSFRCTPDHQIALAEGGYIEAGKSVGRKLVHLKHLNDTELTVVDIAPAGVEDVYDLTVDEVHNFYIVTLPDGMKPEDATKEDAHGILVHNCAEIVEVTNPDEIAVCNLASINLSAFVMEDGTYNLEALAYTVRLAVRALNQVIDVNHAPIKELMASNKTLRPIGLGVQGLADVFQKMGWAYDSEEAQDFNRKVFEWIYFWALHTSHKLVADNSYEPFHTFHESPLAQGKFQFDLAGYPIDSGLLPVYALSWDDLRNDIVKDGVANSLLIALMPTASTSLIFGSTEAFEPVTSNMYTRRVLSGEYMVPNKQLVADLEKLGIWSPKMAEAIKANKGSVQAIQGIPDNLKAVYRTVWEMSMKPYIKMAADRQVFVDQSQSMNLYMQDANHNRIASMHMYAWKQGLKTGMYYFRTQAAVDPIAFTVEQELPADIQACSLDNPNCEACSA